MIFHEKEWQGLSKIISGGQTGSDQGGLAAATALKIPTGGWAPAGWMTSIGPKQKLLENFGLQELVGQGFAGRTAANVKMADATVRLSSNALSPGSLITLQLCQYHNKKMLDIRLPTEPPFWVSQDIKALARISQDAEKLSQFITMHGINILNIAGNRDRLGGQWHYMNTFFIVQLALSILITKGLIHGVGK